MDSSKQSSLYNAQAVIDVQTFLDWVAALADERAADPLASTGADGAYAPGSPIALRLHLRPDSRRVQTCGRGVDRVGPARRARRARHAVRARVLRTRGPGRIAAPHRNAEALSATARDANQRGDNYVLLTVVFASVLFFASLSTKLKGPRNQWLMFGFAGSSSPAS